MNDEKEKNELNSAASPEVDPAPETPAAEIPEPERFPAAPNVKKTAADYQNDAQARVRAKKLRRFHIGKVAATAAVVFCMTALAFALPLRPAVSATEKRELAKFPALTLGTLLDGSFFADVGTWFSDTVPFRDALTGANARLQHLIGAGGAQAGFNEGVIGDEIPDVPETPAADETEETAPPAEAISETAAPPTTAAPATTRAEETEPASEEPSSAVPQFETLGVVLICGNAGYEYYNFVRSTADKYIAAVNRAASVLEGKAQVYAMVIPTSMDITLDPRVRKQITSTDDQKKACAYLESQLSKSVRAVPIFQTLSDHRNEYVYFRTDHHWTQLGAYYAYVEFCGKKGVQPVALGDCVRRDFDGFLGTFYADSNRNPALSETPDVVETFLPPGDSRLLVYDNGGKNVYAGDVIYNAQTNSAAFKYGAFIYGDNPFTVIENNSMESGESCLLVKESFGNAFAPLLIANYKTVYVMDYRYCDQTVAQLVARYGISDVIFANNISMTRSASLVDQMAAKIG